MRWCSAVFASFVVTLCLASGDKATKKPNIIIIVADDMGFNDVGFHGSNEIPTPNIDALAYNGVILNSHYTQALCTPSRSAFLTGKYPIHLGMQHIVILEPEPWGLPLNETLLPQHLKRNGYATHAIGKWHLGFFKKEYTPTYRGFDSHFGYWQGLQDYYKHTVHSTFTSEYGYDMRRNMSVDWSAEGKYSTTLFTEEAVKLIHEHDASTPMFMYLAHLAPHSGNDDDPLQAPDEEIAKFSHIEDPERRVYAAMVSMLDQSVGSVVTALREKHMLENSIILFMSDNGAKPEGIHANHGSNYPLRGTKNSPWEGASRNLAAIWSPLIKQPQRVSNQFMHISDWLPTFYTAAGLNRSELPRIDGIDMWATISEGAKNARTEVLYNIDDVYNYAALRVGDWKYLYGSPSKGNADQWYGSTGKSEAYEYDVDAVLHSAAGNAFAGITTFRQIKEKNLNKKHNREENFTVSLLNEESVLNLRDSATVLCKEVNLEEQPDEEKCDPMVSPCLFNLKEDPCEMVNLVTKRPVIAMNMEQTLLKYKKTAIAPRNVPRDPNADPARWNNTWTNWQDQEYVVKQKMMFNTLSPLQTGLITAACLVIFSVVVIILIISCKNGPKPSRTNSVYEETVHEHITEMLPKCSTMFEDKQRQTRVNLKNEFRTME